MATDARLARARYEAKKQGLALLKSRQRNPTYYDYDRYMLREISTGQILLGPPLAPASLNGSATLDEVEHFLSRGPSR